MKLPGSNINTNYPIILLAIFLGAILIMIEAFVRLGNVGGMAVTIIPLAIIFGILFSLSPYASLWLYIIINYYIIGASRYIPLLKPGGVMLIMTIFLIVVLLFSRFMGSRKNDEDVGMWAPRILVGYWGIWMIYCSIHAFMPGSVFQAWLISANSGALTPLILAISVPLIFRRYKDLKIFLFIFSLLTLTAIAKSLMQKYIGWDSVELHWLFAEGQAIRHIIWSGVRYFSFYSDAANFGAGMAMASVLFGGAALYLPKFSHKIYYGIITLLSLYAMSISGTRTAVIILAVGGFMIIMLSKNWKIILTGVIGVLFVGYFFAFTNIGQGNVNIRRIRSAFRFQQDASFNVRLDNQEKIKVAMTDRPFGYGIGLGADRGERYGVRHKASNIPPDSWYVELWIETGIVGLTIYLIVQALIIGTISIMILFRMKNKEIRNMAAVFISAGAGLMAAGYSNEILIFPNNVNLYLLYAFSYLCVRYDMIKTKELEKQIAIEEADRNSEATMLEAHMADQHALQIQKRSEMKAKFRNSYGNEEEG